MLERIQRLELPQSSRKSRLLRVVVGLSECRINVCIIANSISRNIFKQCLKKTLVTITKNSRSREDAQVHEKVVVQRDARTVSRKIQSRGPRRTLKSRKVVQKGRTHVFTKNTSGVTFSRKKEV